MNADSIIQASIKFIDSHLSAISDDCKKDFAQRSRPESHKANTTLVKEGKFSDKLFFIHEGCVRAYYLKDGKNITDWFGFENDFICAINSYFLNIPSPHYIETIEPATLLVINREDVNYLCDTYHDFDRFARLAVTQTMLQLQQRIVSLQFESAQQKYETLTKLRPDITQRVPLGHIASYLGMTLETLSRSRQPKKSNLI
jgi:CRP-like cAMP-binding protein